MNGERGRVCPADTMAELLKLLRDDLLTLQEVAESMDSKPDTVSRWLKRMHEHGLLDMEMKLARFRRVRAYRVAQAWLPHGVVQEKQP